MTTSDRLVVALLVVVLWAGWTSTTILLARRIDRLRREMRDLMEWRRAHGR